MLSMSEQGLFPEYPWSSSDEPALAKASRALVFLYPTLDTLLKPQNCLKLYRNTQTEKV